MPESKILVVDDDLATRMIVSEALLASDFEVIEAEDGVVALSMFESERPDAILLDLGMPNLDGYDVCTQIRQLFGNTDIPIMVMTATGDVDAVERAFAAGATDFMTKPVNLTLLPYRMRYMLRSAHTTDVVREIARRLVQSQSLARLVHWHVHSDGGFEWANDPMPTLWPGGVSSAPTPQLIDLVHADDRARVAALLASGKAHETEFRIVLPDGSERVMLQHAAAGDAAIGIAMFGATQDVTDRKRAEQQVAKLAFYDDLTGIPNRRLIARYLETRAETPHFVISIDLGLAQTHLNEAGRDRLIRSAAARVIERVRGSDHAQRLDATPRDVGSFGATMVGRVSSDELLVVSAGDNPAAMMRMIESSLAIPFTINEQGIRLAFRLGVAAYPDPVPAISRLPEAARRAMRESDGTIGVYTAGMEARSARVAAIGESLDLALACAPELGEAMSVRYEARVEGQTQRLIGRRAHTVFDRELRKDVGALLDADPVRHARVMMWTLASALREAALWPESLRLAASISSAQLAATGGLQIMEDALAASEFPANRLDLELVDLPESPQDFDAVVLLFTRLRERGIGLGLRVDNRTPLHALSRLPLTYLRVDPSVLTAGLLPAVSAFAETLGLGVAVTGIDTVSRRATIDVSELTEMSGALVEAPVALTAATLDTCLQALV